MGKVVKRSVAVILGGALLALCASASAGNAAGSTSAAKLSDAELDQITAGGAISGVLIFNPGQGPGGFKLNPEGNHVTCINCVEASVPRTSGFVTVVTPNGKIVSHPIRQAPF